ncbi:WAT1-related protein At3g28050 isoform X4 [Eucalyptus grandis]|uniref:WAT1-related protein At3g28050 isoform X4 n=1 Tax=Eucalyptus grandis TaxID=71139 RepID=UPI00192EEE09|nr:WAT1-related protein At3g28050 isoform X4 [Eucalyptus grandis]
MGERHCYRDVLPFSAVITMDSITVSMTTMFKAANSRGMSYSVFLVYTYAIAALLLLPAPFFSLKSRALPPLSLALAAKLGLLGLLGMEEVSLSRRSSQAKIIGTVLSISGASVITLYKGPPVNFTPKPSLLLFPLVDASNSNWVVGGLLLTAEYILVTLWNILLAQIMKEYPAELTVTFFCNVVASLITAILCLVTEHDMSAWRVQGIALASVLCSGLFGRCLNNIVHTWAIQLKGPFYVAMFRPLSIPVAVAMGVFFLGDTLHLGSLIGATILSVGFYIVMWGKAKEGMGEESVESRMESPSFQKVPLLR